MMPLLVPCCRRFKLGDFGLAIDTNLERSKSRVGTLDYMSPEVGRPGHCANTT
jgi:serine/threonine protein kinase